MKDTDEEDAEMLCEKSESGYHEHDGTNITPADDIESTVDVICKYCGRSGSVLIVDADVQW